MATTWWWSLSLIDVGTDVRDTYFDNDDDDDDDDINCSEQWAVLVSNYAGIMMASLSTVFGDMRSDVILYSLSE